MTTEQFCYWLQGLLECRPKGDSLGVRETEAIRDHLTLVFTQVTPDHSKDTSAEGNEELRKLERLKKWREKQIDTAISQTKRIC